MSPNELKILGLAQELRQLDKVTVSRKMDISTDYADCLLKSLSRHGYLQRNGPGANSVYAFTEEGRICLLGYLLQLRAQLQKKIDWLTYQRDRVSEKVQALSLTEVEGAKPADLEAAGMIPVGRAT